MLMLRILSRTSSASSASPPIEPSSLGLGLWRLYEFRNRGFIDGREIVVEKIIWGPSLGKFVHDVDGGHTMK